MTTITNGAFALETTYEVDQYDADGVTPMTWRGPSTVAAGWRITPVLDASGGTLFDIRVPGDEAEGLLSREGALALAMALIAEASQADAVHAELTVRAEFEAITAAAEVVAR